MANNHPGQTDRQDVRHRLERGMAETVDQLQLSLAHLNQVLDNSLSNNLDKMQHVWLKKLLLPQSA